MARSGFVFDLNANPKGGHKAHTHNHIKLGARVVERVRCESRVWDAARWVACSSFRSSVLSVRYSNSVLLFGSSIRLAPRQQAGGFTVGRAERW